MIMNVEKRVTVKQLTLVRSMAVLAFMVYAARRTSAGVA
jgi:hypothetical protein